MDDENGWVLRHRPDLYTSKRQTSVPVARAKAPALAIDLQVQLMIAITIIMGLSGTFYSICVELIL